MSIIPWRKRNIIPVSREIGHASALTDLRAEMDMLFDRFFGSPWPGQAGLLEGMGREAREFMPSIDVKENEEHITILAEVPGMDPEEVEVSVSGNVLTIHGEKKFSTEESGEDSYHCERRFGSFSRSIELPESADLEGIVAEQRNGVLRVRVSKEPAAVSKKIDVKSTPKKLAGAES